MANCFKKSGFFNQSSEYVPDDVATADEEMAEQIVIFSEEECMDWMVLHQKVTLTSMIP